jgi:hypothetical protein
MRHLSQVQPAEDALPISTSWATVLSMDESNLTIFVMVEWC